ncbi:MAG: transposase, partial [Candidatus Pacebacteria bacterium]|nr:transposase [Candidatus Paceibacterota bacterium]
MSYRKEELSDGEIYHVYNRGVDKRIIFEDKQDFFQFLQMLDLCNVDMTCGGLDKYKYPFNLERRNNKSPLVEIISYCLNQNHYHLMLRQIGKSGVSQFMQKVGTAYAMYFNQKNQRTGSLFQGKFKSIHVGTDEYLKGLSAYINLNNVIHGSVKGKQQGLALLFRSSW